MSHFQLKNLSHDWISVERTHVAIPKTVYHYATCSGVKLQADKDGPIVDGVVIIGLIMGWRCYGETSCLSLTMSRICILGGGFGGLYTALELSRYPWSQPPQITLVDRDDRFIFLPLLYELLTQELDEWEVAPRFQDLLNTYTTSSDGISIQFCQGTIQAIDIEAKQVQLMSGSILEYDQLVLALGGDTPLDSIPGAAEHAIPFRQLADVERLKTVLKQWDQTSDRVRIAIAGGGASGVELACKLADRLQDQAQIRLIDRGPALLDSYQPETVKAALEALEQRKITIELATEVIQIDAHAIQVRQTGQEAIQVDPVDTVIWTVGTQVVPQVQQLGLAKDEKQRLKVTPTLQVLEHPEIFALGDLAAVIDAEGQPSPATAQAAFQQAGYCAWNVWAASDHNRPLLPFRYQALGEMLSLGTDTAVLSGMGLTLSGPLAYLVRRAVYLIRMPTLDHQLRVGWNWIAKPFSMELFNSSDG